eukprot:TRINITY_DN34936_c0_g1_i1.p1 TRINITY_DN34936_c0_g1~~TRINITY_DN34936_c0_g1_i1.p1  ORF type:complete len:362 (+),score=65.70 TRINITY_DN34936_c0_g1_i1:116-1201(+)
MSFHPTSFIGLDLGCVTCEARKVDMELSFEVYRSKAMCCMSGSEIIAEIEGLERPTVVPLFSADMPFDKAVALKAGGQSQLQLKDASGAFQADEFRMASGELETALKPCKRPLKDAGDSRVGVLAIVKNSAQKNVALLKDGAKHLGPLEDGLQHGYGATIYPSGHFYEGQFHYGKRHGSGTYRDFVSTNGNSSSGNSSGSTYHGEWQEDKKHGRGIALWDDGTRYDGQYEQDHMQGTGSLRLPSGAVYEGDFSHDDFHGKGTITYADGGKYEGEWKCGRPYGHGRHTAPDNSTYDGAFREGRWHGFGTLTKADKRRYCGQWADGKEHGSGYVVQPDGTCRAGEWHDGQVVKWTGLRRFVQL